MRVLINGQEIVTFEDSQNPFIGGKVGLQASNARIIADDLSLKTVAEHSLPDNHVGHVSISGEAKVGETLTAHVTDGDNFAHDNVFYIWYADNVRIEGASGNTLTLGKAQQGKSITVQAIYTDAHGVSETPVSAPSTKVGTAATCYMTIFLRTSCTAPIAIKKPLATGKWHMPVMEKLKSSTTAAVTRPCK